MSKRILTILVPTYNMQQYLHRCLDSLIVSDPLMKQLEVLVINDGSKDNSSAIAHEYEVKYPDTFRVIDKDNGNYGSCINRGLKEATGKYIKVLDADDWFDTENFEGFLSFLSETDVDLVISDFDKVAEDGSVVSTKHYDIPEGEWPLLKYDAIYDMWMHAVTYKREIFDGLDYHQTEGISYTDQEWIFMPMIRVKTISTFPHVVYKYLVGRVGQTVDPKIFARNISQEVKSWKSQQDIWEQTETGNRGDAEPYLWFRLKSRAVFIATWMILHYYSGIDKQSLYDFDNYVKEHNLKLYDEMNMAVARTGLKFKYIKFWRSFRNRPVAWLLYKVESVLKRRFLGI